MKRLDLADGQWIEFRSPKEVPDRLRRPALYAMMAYQTHWRNLPLAEAQPKKVKGEPQQERRQLDAEGYRLYDDQRRHEAVALISAWSFPVPVLFDSFGDLPADVVDQILALAEAPSGDLVPNFDDPKEPAAS